MATEIMPVHVPGEGTAVASLLLEQARAAWREKQAIDRAATEAQMRIEEERGRELMCAQLQQRLGVQLSPSAVDVTWSDGDCYIRATVDGLTFAAGHEWHEGQGKSLERLWLVRPCPLCGRDALERVDGIVDLGQLLDASAWHPYCPKMRADYEIVDEAEEARKACTDAWEAYGRAKAHEMLLEDQRPLIKAAAVLRLIEAKVATSATAAEKVIEMDTEYMQHRIAQRDAVIATQKAFGVAKAAEFRAQRFAQREGR